MNCEDVALLLDDADTGLLTAEQRRSIEMHLAACADCARDWSLHTRLVARRIPAVPPGLLLQCRAIASSGTQPARARRVRGPLVLFGAVALAAAAALLVVQPWTGGGTRASLSAFGTMADTALSDADADVDDVPPVETPHSPAVQTGEAPAEEPAVAAAAPVVRFSVQMLPLENGATEAPGVAAVKAFHDAVVAELRTIPGLGLLTAESATMEPAGLPEYRLRISGRDTPGSTSFGVGAELQSSPRPDGSYTGVNATSMVGDLGAACTESPSLAVYACSDPVNLARRVVSLFRTMAFPEDPAHRQQIRAQLRDQSLSPERRYNALTELSRLRGSSAAGGQSRGPLSAELGEAEVIQGVIELAAVTTDARRRAELWRVMGGIRSEELRQPLIDAATLDSAPEVRAWAVASLSAGFADDPRARSALESIAREDSRPLVRALAARGLSGAEGWSKYIADSLADTGRPAAERVEALLFHTRWPSPLDSRSMAPWPVIDAVLDARATDALMQVFADAFAEGSPEVKSSLMTLMSSLAYQSVHPVVADTVVENLERGARRMDWMMAAEGLLRRPDPDPRVRVALESIATTSVDEQLRAAAERVLDAASAPSAPGDSTR